jgi:hypothetical protein
MNTKVVMISKGPRSKNKPSLMDGSCDAARSLVFC